MFEVNGTTYHWVLAIFCFGLLRFCKSQTVPPQEVHALEQMASEMGATYWRFNDSSCKLEMVGLSPVAPPGADGDVECNYTYANNTIRHVTKIVIKSYNLPGVLPRSILNLPYLQHVDFAYNLLTGTIPREWFSTQWTFLSVAVNRLSGPLPPELGLMTNLTYMGLDANQFSGSVPPDIGRLLNLEILILSSNQLTGELPESFSSLTNLRDFRINDNNFSGRIPDFIQNWKQLKRLEMFASGLEGPIPENVSLLSALENLRISDLQSPVQPFPVLENSTNLVTLVLRNCNITGEIPDYIWRLRVLRTLDLTFNNLVGEIPNDISRSLMTVFLTSNMLTGRLPNGLLKDFSDIDISYNNFTLEGPDDPACQQNMNRDVKMLKSSSTSNALQRIDPCSRLAVCPEYKCSLHINCGGDDFTNEENGGKVLYEGDSHGNAARFSSNNHWGFVSTGYFFFNQDQNHQDSRRINASTNGLSELYSSARLSPLSLSYFHYCLENGSYNVRLHFAELLFTNDSTFRSLGRRKFDVYIQEKLVLENFDIQNEAGGPQRPLVKYFNVTVIDNTLVIRFYWASKGTTRIPNRGDYGSLVSAISVVPSFGVCSKGKKLNTIAIILPVVLVASIIAVVLVILWWKGLFSRQTKIHKALDGLELQTIAFSLKQIRAATNDFDAANKIGEGGFGPVYKGTLTDGTVIAVKKLSSMSKQGNREFMNEIFMISCLQHPNLVKLCGCCIEGDALLVVYEYMENNNLAHALFDSNINHLNLDWPSRFNICVGIARGLAFLHEESKMRIVHRDIKATNVLLDKDLNPKISDFGLARHNESDKTHISTKIVGTIGYMAPEYALWGYLTDKADVYSFGIVVLEVVSGKRNNYLPCHPFICLLDWASDLHENKKLDKLLDERLGSQVNMDEADRVVKVARLCTNANPSVRPSMSEVVKMLDGTMETPVIIPIDSSEDVKFKAMKDFRQGRPLSIRVSSQSQNTTMDRDAASSSSSAGSNQITNEGSSFISKHFDIS